VISPDGSYAFVRFTEQNRAVSRLANLDDGNLSAALPGTVQGMPSFARDRGLIAVSIGVSASGGDARIEVHDAEAWLAAPTPVPALWASSIPASEPVLSADGSRIAYFHVWGTSTNAVVVVDWAANHVVFSERYDRTIPSSLSLSADGQFVTWVAPGTGTNSAHQVWRADVNTGSVVLVSVSSDGSGEGNGNSKYAGLSPDGRYVAFASLADNLVPEDHNGAKDVFLRDMETGVTLLVSRAPDGTQGNGWSLKPCFSGDGRSLFYLSHAPNLAPGDLNESVDLYHVEIQSGDSGLLVVIERNLETGQAWLKWNGEPGKQYGIEFKEELDAAVWQRVPGEFTGETPVAVDTAMGTRRFLRVFESQ
jgi:Tol biopolymer transport system component